MKPHLIKKFLKEKKIDFYLVTNNDLHLNESPNLNLKDIYQLFKFDCTRGYILFLLINVSFLLTHVIPLQLKNFLRIILKYII